MRRSLFLPAAVLGLIASPSIGDAVTVIPPGSDDDAIEELAESAFDKWVRSQGAILAGGTIACGVDSISSHSVYCYGHADLGIVAAVAPIPTGDQWEFTLIAGALGSGAGNPIPTSWPEATVNTTPFPTVTTPATAPETTGPDSTTSDIGDGIHEVNVDIAPGRYQSESSEFCYWARLSDDSDALISNSIVEDGVSIVDIQPSDVGFESSGCGTWHEYAPPREPATTFESGVFVVGSDIVPGVYATDGGESCAWRRLAEFTADGEDIIDIDLPEGPATVEILASDEGFSSVRCGAWTLQPG